MTYKEIKRRNSYPGLWSTIDRDLRHGSMLHGSLGKSADQTILQYPLIQYSREERTKVVMPVNAVDIGPTDEWT